MPHDWSSNRPEIEFAKDNDINFKENYSIKYEERIEASVVSVAKFGERFPKQQAMKTVRKSWIKPALVSQLIIIIIIISRAGWVRQDSSDTGVKAKLAFDLILNFDQISVKFLCTWTLLTQQRDSFSSSQRSGNTLKTIANGPDYRRPANISLPRRQKYCVNAFAEYKIWWRQ